MLIENNKNWFVLEKSTLIFITLSYFLYYNLINMKLLIIKLSHMIFRLIKLKDITN